MLARWLMIRHCRRLIGEAAIAWSDGGGLPCQIAGADWLGLTALDVAGDTVLIPWRWLERLDHGEQCRRNLESRRAALGRLLEALEKKGQKPPGLPAEDLAEILEQYERMERRAREAAS